MTLSESIILEIFKDVKLSPKEVELVESKFRKLELDKGDVLLDEGSRVDYQYFVYSGCLRTYFLDKTGKEHTLQFAIKDWWISDYTAFFTSSHAIMNIECIQDATIYKVSRGDMESAFTEVHQLETFFRKKMEGAFASFQKRILESLSLPAKDRYRSFITTYPNIEQSVKNYHIASYLGITTESLSRIRKEIALS